MKIYYEGFYFNIPMVPYLYIRIKQCILLTRRIWRIVTRMGKYALSVLPVVLLLPICALALWLINVNSIYSSYLDVIWDIRSTIIGSIIISYALIVAQGESQRRRRLKELYYKYYYIDSALYGSIEECASFVRVNEWNSYPHVMFQSDCSVASYKRYLEMIRTNYHGNLLEPQRVKNIKNTAQSLKDSLSKRITGYFFDKELMNISNDDLHCLMNDFDKLNKHIDKASLFCENIDINTFIDWLIRLVEYSYDYLSILSIIWSGDNDINNKIRYKISRYDKFHKCYQYYFLLDESQEVV